jgi:hypothetical protein
MVLQMVPKEIVDQHQADLLITVESSQTVNNSTLQVSIGPGLQSTPQCLPVPAFSGKVIQHVVISRTDEPLLAGEHPLIVELTEHAPAAAGQPAVSDRLCAAPKTKILASQSLTFQFHPEIRLWAYLLLGMVGVGIGWLLRFFINALKSIPPPLPAPAAEAGVGGSGGFFDWLKRHYYGVDCLVTLGIGLAVLVFMAKTGRPPEGAALPPGALATGIGLGLLTNSELLTRLR